MIATVSDVAVIIITIVITLGVVLLGLAVLARRGRRVHVSVDVGEPSDDEEAP